jgi:hypothetical protein
MIEAADMIEEMVTVLIVEAMVSEETRVEAMVSEETRVEAMASEESHVEAMASEETHEEVSEGEAVVFEEIAQEAGAEVAVAEVVAPRAIAIVIALTALALVVIVMRGAAVEAEIVKATVMQLTLKNPVTVLKDPLMNVAKSKAEFVSGLAFNHTKAI